MKKKFRPALGNDKGHYVGRQRNGNKHEYKEGKEKRDRVTVMFHLHIVGGREERKKGRQILLPIPIPRTFIFFLSPSA